MDSETPDETREPEVETPKVRPISPAMPVPVFSLVVYVREVDDAVEAEVANLPGILAAAPSEPLALKSVITLAKQRLAKWHAAGEAIPWVDPVPTRGTDQVERLVALHL